MNSLIILGALAFIYLMINVALPRLDLDTSLKTYLFQPLMWGALAAAVWSFSRRTGERPLGKFNSRDAFIMLAVTVAVVQVVLYFLGGLISGFGKNPASMTATGILTNIVFVGSMLIAFELCRAFLVGRLGRQRPFLAIAAVALLFTVISIPLSQFTGFTFTVQTDEMVISSWLPLLSENLFATALALLAGARASLTYRAILAVFWWFSPILPDLEWALRGIIGAAAPLLGLVAANNHYAAQKNRGKPRKRAAAESLPAGWIVATLACVLIVWFAVGIFPWKPTLVGSGSMSPYMETGDVVLVVKTEPSDIKIGDVIQYRKKENDVPIDVLHRVIDTVNVSGIRYFITKGDANDDADIDPVDPAAVQGRVTVVVPKIGWVSITVKKLFTSL
jgi:signal peptidase